MGVHAGEYPSIIPVGSFYFPRDSQSCSLRFCSTAFHFNCEANHNGEVVAFTRLSPASTEVAAVRSDLSQPTASVSASSPSPLPSPMSPTSPRAGPAIALGPQGSEVAQSNHHADPLNKQTRGQHPVHPCDLARASCSHSVRSLFALNGWCSGFTGGAGASVPRPHGYAPAICHNSKFESALTPSQQHAASSALVPLIFFGLIFPVVSRGLTP